MLKIDISFKLHDMNFVFKADITPNEKHVFNVGERILADKLFYVLTGLDTDYNGVITGADWSHSENNNVLAFGDKTMFVSGSVRRNIYKSLRLRMKRKHAQQKTDYVMCLYNLYHLKDTKISNVKNEELFRIALARAHFRDIKLVVANCFQTFVGEICDNFAETFVNNFTNKIVPYIIEIY